MMKTQVNKRVTVAFATVLVAVLCLCSACTAKSVINELPDEQIIKVVRVTVTLEENAKEIETELAEEKISSFYDLLKMLKYKKKNNVFGIKSSEFDRISYIITYNSYTVKLSAHHLLVLHGEEAEKEITFSSTQPSSSFDEIYKLFE